MGSTNLPWLRQAAASSTNPPASMPVGMVPPAATPQPSSAQPAGPVVPAHPVTGEHPITIVELTAANVKRLSAVTIRPDGSLVVLSGRNGQGKTSVLDAIEYALGGKPDVAEPVRRGEDSAEVVCDLGDLIVRRRFITGGSSTLEVTTREGLRYPKPQNILDELVGRLTFDPLAFARQKPADQRATLQQLVGLDFSQEDQRAALVYSERTAVNREAKAAKARLASMAEHVGVPAEPVSAAELAAQMQAAQVMNGANAALRRRLTEYERQVTESDRRIAQAEAELVQLRAARQGSVDLLTQTRAAVAAATDVDLAPLTAQLAALDQTNAKVRANQQRREIAAELAAREGKAREMTAELESIEQRKAAAIAAARMPVPGLGLADAGVTLNGFPLEQASAAEQLRVSVAIALAMNPRLRVLLIRDASLLDQDSLHMVAEMARAAGAQVWLERVEVDGATTVVIEDGQATTVAAGGTGG
jgi:hypothetical protein